AAKKVPQLNPDLDFIKEAAMLHDIGIFLTNIPELNCKGKNPYICHGYLGREILEKIGFPEHALVCERHVGVGITVEDIKHYALPLPKRNMLPVSIEEQIICFADKFFSKNRNSLKKEKSVEDIKKSLEPYGLEKVKRFQSWVDLFENSL
ncbi:MAG: HD domain-containing protein, partial [Deltaproteobacteria bacterium]|nr:HD domain-containing protein [Deltaproteobacteria bacterium]